MSHGTLYIVSTPIGNLEDITLRALRILKEVDVVAAEDTRHSGKLLAHFGLQKTLISYWGEKEKTKAEEVLAVLHSGRSVALISDAGTPGISDPGSVLISRAIESGVSVVPVPGPSALITALSISGFSTAEFVFVGFLPPKQTQRTKKLRELSLEKRTVIIYEAPHRIIDTAAEIEEIFGTRRAVIVKELTKLFEVVYRGTLQDVVVQLKASKIAGEYVVVIEGRGEEEGISAEEALSEMKSLMKKGLSRKDAAKRIAEQYGMSKKELYDKSLE